MLASEVTRANKCVISASPSSSDEHFVSQNGLADAPSLLTSHPNQQEYYAPNWRAFLKTKKISAKTHTTHCYDLCRGGGREFFEVPCRVVRLTGFSDAGLAGGRSRCSIRASRCLEASLLGAFANVWRTVKLRLQALQAYLATHRTHSHGLCPTQPDLPLGVPALWEHLNRRFLRQGTNLNNGLCAFWPRFVRFLEAPLGSWLTRRLLPVN